NIHRRLLSVTLFPYTTLFRSWPAPSSVASCWVNCTRRCPANGFGRSSDRQDAPPPPALASRVSTGRWPCSCSRSATSLSLAASRSEEHTSELQSRENIVCRLL